MSSEPDPVSLSRPNPVGPAGPRRLASFTVPGSEAEGSYARPLYMSKRLFMLEKMVQQGAADAFTRYALALEYKSLERWDDAELAFVSLRDAHPDYVPQYLMAGQLLIDRGRPDDARPWLEAGLAVAQKAGDQKAASELADALGNC